MLDKNSAGTLAFGLFGESGARYGKAGLGLVLTGAGKSSLDGLLLSRGFMVVEIAIIYTPTHKC